MNEPCVYTPTNNSYKKKGKRKFTSNSLRMHRANKRPRINPMIRHTRNTKKT